MRVANEKAYAKINLYLDVTSVRDDGFHDIKTVMHQITLSDDVSVTVKDSKTAQVKIIIEGDIYLPADDKNLAVRAAYNFMNTLGITSEVLIKLKKRIPVSAGLAGGSADAAAVLKAMNRIFRRPFGERKLLEIGEALGSDVPFCITGKTALCEGRGERVLRLPKNLALNFVIAVGNEHISTPWAYRELDNLYSNFDGTKDSGSEFFFSELKAGLDNGVLNPKGLFNIFESAVLPYAKEASLIKEKLVFCGAIASMMSGSGPSVFGIFDSEQEAVRSAELLRQMGYTAYFAKSVG